MSELPILYYIGITIFIIIIGLLILGTKYLERKSTVQFPKNFYMRKPYLPDVIPALRKVVTKPVHTVTVDFSKVEGMTEGSFMVFLAQVEKALMLKKNVRIHPILPKSKEVLKILSAQKNYKHKNVQIDSSSIPDRANSDNLVDTDYVDEAVDELKKLGFTDYYKPFYDYLVELIGNATEHGINHQNINWWMLKYRDYSDKSMKYVFVDMGSGIIKSYQESGMLWKYLLKDKRQIPLDALNGKLGSSTKKSNRGRGLPQIREIIEKGYISNFILVTNDVSLQYIDNKFVASRNPNFVGTYYSWTINKENFVTWKNSL